MAWGSWVGVAVGWGRIDMDRRSASDAISAGPPLLAPSLPLVDHVPADVWRRYPHTEGGGGDEMGYVRPDHGRIDALYGSLC